MQPDLSGVKYADYLSATFAGIRALGGSGTPCTSVTFVLGFPASVKKKIGTYREYVKNEEAFAVKLGKKTVIYAIREEGFLFAASTLLALAEDGALCEGFLYDYPIDDIRGYRATLPVRYGTHLATDRFDSYATQSEYREATYSTLPKKCGERFVYECVYENPHPQAAVSSITFVPDNGFETTDVELLAVDFGGTYADVTGQPHQSDGQADTGFILYE